MIWSKELNGWRRRKKYNVLLCSWEAQLQQKLYYKNKKISTVCVDDSIICDFMNFMKNCPTLYFSRNNLMTLCNISAFICLKLIQFLRPDVMAHFVLVSWRQYWTDGSDGRSRVLCALSGYFKGTNVLHVQCKEMYKAR